jgi:hypothetical protein
MVFLGTYVSMKLMPTKSFFIRIWPSLGSGTGRSVLYCSTSVPPFFSMITPFIVLGMEEDAMVRMCESVLVREESCDEMAATRRVELENSEFERMFRAVNMGLGWLEDLILR